MLTQILFLKHSVHFNGPVLILDWLWDTVTKAGNVCSLLPWLMTCSDIGAVYGQRGVVIRHAGEELAEFWEREGIDLVAVMQAISYPPFKNLPASQAYNIKWVVCVQGDP